MRGRPSAIKRQKELKRQEKRQLKAEKRAQRHREKESHVVTGEDPDIAGIIPGPQPVTAEENE